MKFLSIFLICFSLYANANLDCEQLENSPGCDGSILAIPQIKDLLNIAVVVRADNANCIGATAVASNINALKTTLIQASFSPREYAKTLLKPEETEKLKDIWSGYFRYWGYQSFYNYSKFSEFWDAYNHAQTPLVKFYEQKGFKTLEAAYFATSILNEILKYSVASYPDMNNLPDITQEQKALSDKNISYDGILAILYSKNFTLKQIDEILKTALVLNKSVDIISQILKLGAQINVGDESALFFALGSYENMKFLIQNGADVNYKNAFGKSILFYAVELNNIDMIRLLIQNGANVNEKIIDENTKSAILNVGESLPFYINLCALEHTNKSVLMDAAAYSTPEILDILIQNGANLNDIDDIGFSVLDYAKKYKNDENVKFLQNLGVKSNIYE
ncbi:ankyrin repeat domain-containing protein [Campylobacter mucosalis]|uniref:Ankyrin domain protein n=1 Tax=Campylobacter mucosalis CCUG 21559 TaxID=1032067 RepID=A0A6G5QHU3_9BACT|nr:ankyrin repeat domain-containing protein [Campylobacter mucosalis]QCD45240.1 ankyrin domain protein [Campylobacter mucosalis CCUG 21559]